MKANHIFIAAPHLLFAAGLLSVGIVSESPALGIATLGAFFFGLYLSYRRGRSLSQQVETWSLVLAVPIALAYALLRGEHGTLAIQYWLAAVLVVRSYRRLAQRDYMAGMFVALALYAHMGRIYTDIPFLYITLLYAALLPCAFFQFLACFGGFRQYAAPSQNRPPSMRRLFRRMAFLSAALLVTATLIFLALPRPNMASMFNGPGGNPRTASTGFSDKVPLGSFDRIRGRRDIVLVVETDTPRYWRATALDVYENGTWYETTKAALRQRRAEAPLTPGARTTARRFRIFSRAMVNNRLFSCGNVASVQRIRTPRDLWINDLNSALYARFDAPGDETVEYVVIGQDAEFVGVTALTRRNWRSPVKPDEFFREDALYLQLPGDLSDNIRRLAVRLTADKPTPEAKAEAVQDHLLANYAYSLENLAAVGKPALDYFLFDAKKGHCEYFATAMAIMLRAAGVRARVVQGFAPGVEMDGRCLVRLSDAHLWAEIFVPGRGWKSYDPTPGAADRMRPAAAENFIEQMKLHWAAYVVGYDGGLQTRMLINLQEISVRLLRHAAAAAGLIKIISAALLILFAAILAIHRGWLPRLDFSFLRMKKGLRGEAARARSFFNLYLETLARKGYVRKPGTTPNDLLSALIRDKAPVIDDARFLTLLFYQIRFGGVPFTIADERSARAAIRRIRAWTAPDVGAPTRAR